MKKVSSIIIAVSIAALGMFTSCDPSTVEPVGPEVVYQNYDGGDLTLAAGQDTIITMVVNEGDAKLIDVVVSISKGGISDDIYIASEDADNVEDGMQIILPIGESTPGTYVVTITATDKDGIETVETINLVVSSDLTVKEVILGAGANANGSYVSLNGTVLNVTEAKAAPATVLFAYNEISGVATILSGTEVTSTEINTVADETTFQVLTGVDFNSATSDDVPANMTSTTIAIATGDVVAYSNAGAKGVFKVGAIQAGAAGQAALSIAVKEL